jgi:hypothetical protein
MQQMNFVLQILWLAQHVSGTFMPIIRNSRVLYKWLLSVVFGAWFSSCRYSVELRVVCPVCGLLQQHVSIFYEIIFREFFIYFLVDVADIKIYQNI